jgi:hypothetical protein
MSTSVAARVRALAAAGKSVSAIGIETGTPIRTVRAVLERPPTAQELAEQDRLTGWAPLCMEQGDWAHWQRMNPSISDLAARPCSDCPVGFAAEMRAEGKCNGTPGWRPPADDHEEADVGDTITVSKVTISAPCGSCAHREVCAIRRTLGGLEEADVTIPKPDPALTIALGISVECSHYLRARNTGNGGAAKGRKLNLSPEERARRGERIQAAAKAHREAAAVGEATA